MDVRVNTIAIVSSIVVGSIWDAQVVFGKVWIKLTKIDMKKYNSIVFRPITVTFVVSLIRAYD